MINFVKYKNYCLVLSFLILAAGVYGFFKNGGFLYGVDFTGGTEIRVKFDGFVDISDFRKVLGSSAVLGDLSIQAVGKSTFFASKSVDNSEFIIKVRATGPDVEKEICQLAQQGLGQASSVQSVEAVGPEAGMDVRNKTIYSILLVLLVLLVYIGIRHRYDYAIGAVAALVHDILVLLSFYLIFKVKITVNVLAGVLTMLGYSLNDTIVIFSRIRENAKVLKGVDKNTIVNTALNQTLRRTLLTSLTTFLSVAALYLFGGEVLSGFSITMLIAVIFGTYSSIFVASPVMLALNPKGQL